MAQLQREVQSFILKLAAEFPPRKEQLIFLINNYDMMLGVLMVSLSIMFCYVVFFIHQQWYIILEVLL